MSFPDQVP